MNTPRVYIATLLPPTGETGVQTHFNTFYDYATRNGLRDIHIITPYATTRLIRGPLRRSRTLCEYYNKELAIRFGRLYLYLLLVRQLAARLRTDRSPRNIIYAQDPLSAKAGLALKAQGYPVEVVLVVHFNISQAYEAVTRGVAREGGPLWRDLIRLEEEIIPQVDRLIFVSQFMERKVLERIPGATTVPRWVIPNIANDVQGQSNGNMAGDLITIGTIERRKNQGFLLHVLAEVHRLGYKYRMTVVGDGEHRSTLMNLVKTLRIEESVSFAGYIPNAQSLMQGHKAYVHASLMENFAIVMVEALARGVPVFAPPVGGVPEVFSDGIEGVYWDLDDPVESARKLVAVLEDDARYERMAKAARTRYECHFAPTVLGPRLVSAVLGNQERVARISAQG